MTGGLPPVAERGVTYSEAFRHACEVRHVCALPGADRVAYFTGRGERPRPLAAVRGAQAADRLAADVRAALDVRRGQRAGAVESRES